MGWIDDKRIILLENKLWPVRCDIKEYFITLLCLIAFEEEKIMDVSIVILLLIKAKNINVKASNKKKSCKKLLYTCELLVLNSKLRVVFWVMNCEMWVYRTEEEAQIPVVRCWRTFLWEKCQFVTLGRRNSSCEGNRKLLAGCCNINLATFGTSVEQSRLP